MSASPVRGNIESPVRGNIESPVRGDRLVAHGASRGSKQINLPQPRQGRQLCQVKSLSPLTGLLMSACEFHGLRRGLYQCCP